MARRRHRRRGMLHGLGMDGIMNLDLGSPLKNVGLGAGINLAGSVLAKQIPAVGNALGKIPVLGKTPGFALGVLVAAYKFFTGKKAVAYEIGLGAVLVSAAPLLQDLNLLPMGLVTTDYMRGMEGGMGAVVPTVRMSDGSVRALTDGEYGGPAVVQGLEDGGLARHVEVFQGGILQ